MPPFSSAAYWEARYRSGGTSGAGSAGTLARYKAATVNRFIAANDISSMIDMGCGDASQLALLTPPADYVGVDISPDVLARCASLFPERRFVAPEELGEVPPAELTLSLDVLYHLVEDAVFAAAIHGVFHWSTRFVLIYSSNVDAVWPAAHVRHRRFTDHVAKAQPAWRLLAHLPNPHPYDPARPNDTSFADFYVYGKPGAPAVVPVPGD
jgi:SAM-dependent methyltransferase